MDPIYPKAWKPLPAALKQHGISNTQALELVEFGLDVLGVKSPDPVLKQHRYEYSSGHKSRWHEASSVTRSWEHLPGFEERALFLGPPMVHALAVCDKVAQENDAESRKAAKAGSGTWADVHSERRGGALQAKKAIEDTSKEGRQG